MAFSSATLAVSRYKGCDEVENECREIEDVRQENLMVFPCRG